MQWLLLLISPYVHTQRQRSVCTAPGFCGVCWQQGWAGGCQYFLVPSMFIKAICKLFPSSSFIEVQKTPIPNVSKIKMLNSDHFQIKLISQMSRHLAPIDNTRTRSILHLCSSDIIQDRQCSPPTHAHVPNELKSQSIMCDYLCAWVVSLTVG